MPHAILSIIAIASAVSSGVSTIKSLTSHPSIPKAGPATPSGPSTDQARAAITPQALTIEGLTGGSVSPEYLSTIAPVLAGVGGQPNTQNAMQQVLQQLFGGGSSSAPVGGAGGGTGGSTPPGSSSSAGFTPSSLPINLQALAASPGISDFLAKVATAMA